MYFRLLLMFFIDGAMHVVKSITNDRQYRVSPQNSDHQKPNYRSKNGGFMSFKLVINDFFYCRLSYQAYLFTTPKQSNF